MVKPAASLFAKGAVWLTLAAGFVAAADAADLRVARITPSGDDVRGERQIAIAFDQSVVPLGRMERRADEVPATVSPDPGCEWRWLDPQVLACNLPPGETLLPATTYTVTLTPGLATVEGAVMRSGMTHRFVTERPRVQYAQVVEWRGPEQPELRVRFNQPVTASSVATALALGGKVEVGPELFDAQTPFYTPEGEARTLWRVWPRTALRADRRYALTVDAGLSSALGTARGVRVEPALVVHTFPALRYLGIECSVGDVSRRFAPGQDASGCAPLEFIGLVFSAPVSRSELREHLQLAPMPATEGEDSDPWAGAGDDRPVSWRHAEDQTYSLALPFAFAAEHAYALTLAPGLRDRFGRALEAGAQNALHTGSRRPRFVFEHQNAVIESGLDTEVPAVVTNLEAIVARYTRMTADGMQPDLVTRVPVAPARNVAFAMPLDVRGMVGAASGAVRGELEAQPEDGRPREFFAEVTPWQVHAKLGHANTLVWVTRLDDGTPVADAEVELIEGFGDAAKASTRTDANGVAWLPGSGELDPDLSRAWRSGSDALAVRVRRDPDFALLPLEYAFSVDTWRASREQVSAWRRERHGHLRSWGTTAQGVYRAGDTVQYKIYVRDDAGKTLSAAPPGSYALSVYDPTGTVVHERKDLSLSRFGALDGEFALSKTAAVGWYRFELKPSYSENALEPLRVLIADFTPAPFRVSAELRAKAAEPGKRIDAVVTARLHGGGPFGGAALRVLSRLQATGFSPQHPLASRFRFDSYAPDGRELQPLLDAQERLDAQGEWQGAVVAEDGPVRYGQLVIEGSVEDDRGRSIAARGSIPFHGRDRYVGLRYDGWILREGERTGIEALVVDAQGQPQSGTPYYVKVERQQTKGARVKGAGNAYITRYTQEWQRVETCKGRSTLEGMRCAFTPDAAGEYRITALVRDTQDRLHETGYWLYAQGSGEVLWEESPDYSLELRAEQAQWKVGETARFLVKNPFPGARALITVERYGVLEQRVEILKGSTPVIEIAVKPEFVPGAYVSVVVMSPRVEQPLNGRAVEDVADSGCDERAAALTPPSAAPTVPPSPACGRGTNASLRDNQVRGVDLGKPTFRMGYATLSVDEPYRQIEVAVTPAREQYRPRETVELQLRARPRNDRGEPIEFAVAVLDEAVFDLIQTGADYFDPHKGFTALDPLDLQNYGLLTRLVGRQKFEKKGANPGGDGGADLSLRSIERFVAYWNPALAADAQGRATLSFPLPDQLTGWRVLAMATTPTDRMGLGQAGIKVSKPTELRPAMPNQLAVGDRFEAGFTVLNRADRVRRIDVELRASGGAEGHTQTAVELAPFERKTVMLPLSVERAAPIAFDARAGDAADSDALAHVVPVRPRRVSATAADLASLSDGETVTLTIAVPAEAQEPRLLLDFAPTLIGSLDGAFDYLRGYPYLCWEQRLSKGVMAAHYLQLGKRVGDDFAWPDAADTVRAMLADAASFQAPNGGMAFFVPVDTHVSPYLSAFTGLAFGWLQDLGHAPPAVVWNKLDTYLLRLLREDPPETGYDNREARAQLRAVTLAALARRGRVDAAELARHAPQLNRMGLFGESLFLQAAQRVDGAQAASVAARDRILARASESAGRLSLQDDDDGAWAWLLGSSMRSNCAALSALIGEREYPEFAELPLKLVRHVVKARGARTHWSNTQETLFCTRALIDYGAAFESEPVQLQATATLDGAALGTVDITPASAPTLSRGVERRDAQQSVAVAARGQGRAYLSTRLQYIEPDDTPAVNAGLSIERRYAVRRNGEWQTFDATPLRLRRGELLKVELDVDVPAWMAYVVVDDPVPGGIEPLNPDLATTAGVDLEALAAGSGYPWPFYHRELRFEAVRHFADYVPQGRYRMVWIGQAVAVGEFRIGRPHVEQMYDPDVYGNGVAARLIVEEVKP